MEPGGPAFALGALLSLGRTPFALLCRPLMLPCGRCMFCLALLRHPLMLVRDSPMFRRPPPLIRGTVLTRPGRLLCSRSELHGPFALTRSLGVLVARPDGVGLRFLAMRGCLAAKALALAAPVLGYSSGREQHQRDHDHDADDDRDHDNG